MGSVSGALPPSFILQPQRSGCFGAARGPPGRTQAPVGPFDVEGFLVLNVEAGINTSPRGFTRDDRHPFNPNGSGGFPFFKRWKLYPPRQKALCFFGLKPVYFSFV